MTGLNQMTPRPQLQLLSHYTGGCCHMLRFGCSEAHMPLQETSKNRPRAQQSTVWSLSYLQTTIITTHAQTYTYTHCLNGAAANFTTQNWKSAGIRLLLLDLKKPTWFDFPLLLRHGEHSRYCALATCAKQTLVNGGQVSSRQWIPQCAHRAWIPPGS